MHHRHETDPTQVVRRELDRVRDYVERILQAADNPNCYQCAAVRRLAREALRPAPPSPDDWALDG